MFRDTVVTWALGMGLASLGACADVNPSTSSGSSEASSSTGTTGLATGDPDGGGVEDPASSTGRESSADTAGSSSSGADSTGNGSDGGGSSDSGGSDPIDTRVRIVAANLSSGNFQSYDPGHGIRILQGLDADITLVQEFNYGTNSAEDLQSMVDAVCLGPGRCTYVRGPDAQIPNGIISRWPVIESGSVLDPEVSNRDFVWARIDGPGEVDLWVVSVHLLTANATQRNLEAVALMAWIDEVVDPADYVVVGGDLNTGSRSEPALDTFDPRFEVQGPYPADHRGLDGTNKSRAKPYDWVIVDDQLHAHRQPVRFGPRSFPHGAVVDTRVYHPLAEIAPAMPTDSGVEGMQHMAVVRDFELP